jgi:hypothetical protein
MLLSGPEISPMLPAEPSITVEKYQIIQLHRANWARLNSEDSANICVPQRFTTLGFVERGEPMVLSHFCQEVEKKRRELSFLVSKFE